MTKHQLYFALGVPVLVYLFGFTATVLLTFWQVRDLREELRSGMNRLYSQMDLIMSKVTDIDTRVAVLEDRSGR